MFTEYVQAAMKHAEYEIIEDDGRYYGHIPGLQGLWADGDTMEECQQTLRECLEEWLMLGIRLGHEIPVIDGIDLNRSITESEAA